MTTLKTGLHLVIIQSAELIIDGEAYAQDKETGSYLVQMTYQNDKGITFTKTWGTEHDDFIRMCDHFGIDMEADDFVFEAVSRRGWIAIKEIHEISGENPVIGKDGHPVIHYELFDTFGVSGRVKKPVIIGDPETNKGKAGGPFLGYISTAKETVEAPKTGTINWDEL